MTTYTREQSYETLMLGIQSMRDDMGISKPVTQQDLAAVWSWAGRASRSEGVDHDFLVNVLDGLMWADWQQGSIVFRLTPRGTAHVESMARDRAAGSVEDLMRQMGMDPEALRVQFQRESDD